jgi:uncharacterized protein (TIGR02271 family)
MEDNERNNAQPGSEEEEIRIPVVEEDLVADTRAVKTGSVRVQKHVERRIRTVETPLLQEEVEVRRVPVNRVVSEMPAVRKQSGEIIVPVVEEELVISKRLVLKEEIHLSKKRTRKRVVREVELERERAEVQRLDPEGRVVASSTSARDNREEQPPRPARGRS